MSRNQWPHVATRFERFHWRQAVKVAEKVTPGHRSGPRSEYTEVTKTESGLLLVHNQGRHTVTTIDIYKSEFGITALKGHFRHTHPGSRGVDVNTDVDAKLHYALHEDGRLTVEGSLGHGSLMYALRSAPVTEPTPGLEGVEISPTR